MSIQRAKLVLGFLGLVVLATSIALELGVQSPHAATAAVSQIMRGAVSDNDTIVLTFVDGTSVGSQTAPGPTIPPGTYSVAVFDDSELDNFHLLGPGVDQSTGVLDNSSPNWTVTFQPGSSYRYQSDSRPNALFGVFQTSGATGSSGSTSSGGYLERPFVRRFIQQFFIRRLFVFEQLLFGQHILCDIVEF